MLSGKTSNYLVKHATASPENIYKLKLSCLIGNDGNNRHGLRLQEKYKGV